MPVSEQISGTHGPAEDDAIKRQDRRELQEHGDEWPDEDAPDEGEPDAVWAEEGRFAGEPPGEDWLGIELRTELARHLNRTDFPVTRAHLLDTLTTQGADQRLLDRVSALPGRARFASLGELVPALGLPVERRPNG
jgi:Protein of unknown function (DUF2795)